MTNTRDRKERPLIHAIITSTLPVIIRTILAWIINHFDL